MKTVANNTYAKVAVQWLNKAYRVCEICVWLTVGQDNFNYYIYFYKQH